MRWLETLNVPGIIPIRLIKIIRVRRQALIGVKEPKNFVSVEEVWDLDVIENALIKLRLRLIRAFWG